MEAAVKEPEVGYPLELSRYAGRINDTDAHEWVPPESYVEQFGKITQTFADIGMRAMEALKREVTSRRLDVDETNEITKKTAWFTKGPYAPGSYDMAKRLEIMDFCGVDKQLIFAGGVPISCLFLLGNIDDKNMMPEITGDRRKYAYDCIHAYNEWAVRQHEWSARLRTVAVLVGNSVDELYADAKRLIDRGIRAIWLPSSILPGGKSPAHEDHDRLWDLLQGSNTSVLLHIGNEAGFYATLGWRQANAFLGWQESQEVQLDPWTLGNLHMPSQSFLNCMISGGVFERFPRLRFGAIETGAEWLGPMAQTMDRWATALGSKWTARFSMLPSDYVRRNVRVTGFPDEPIDIHIEHHGLDDCYCYASDYPHFEGGTDPMGFWSQRLDRLGEGVKEKFFVKNAEWIMPD